MKSNISRTKCCEMMATLFPVKMAACLPQDGDITHPEKTPTFTISQTHKQQAGGTQGITVSLSATSADIKLQADKAYEEVAKYDEEDLRTLLEEVTNVGKKDKDTISPYALALIRKEQDALREESSSDDGELALRHRNKKLSGRRDQSAVNDQSAAARASTGGSLGSLHDSGEPKPKEGHNQGVASRCREGGSCGNLSRGSFETQPPRKRKGRRSKDHARASTSQREGGSLQNLSKAETANNHHKNLHKSGSLSQVCSEVTGARNKNRRQKTSSESSSCRHSRRSEDREGAESSGEENPCHRPLPSPHSTLSTQSAEHPFPPEGVGGASGLCTDWNDIDDSVSDDATEGETTEDDENKESARALGLLRNCSNEPIEEDGIELKEVTVHKTISEVDRCINFSLSRSQEENMPASFGRRSIPFQDSQCVNSIFRDEKVSGKGSDFDDISKRKPLANRSDSTNSENKSSLDENGNPIMGSSNSSSLFTSASTERPFLPTHSVSRRNGFSIQHKEISRFDRLKAKSDKKKANKEKGVVNIKETPGFCGDKDIHDILKYLGADNETSTKGRKKHKNREDEKVKKRNKNSEKTDEEKLKDFTSKCCDEVNVSGIENNKRNKEKEEERKTSNNKKNRNENGKKNKKSGSLRESSSVEDLVSKSKQSDSVCDIRKQVTVDDGDMGLELTHTYHTRNKVDELNNFIDGTYLKQTEVKDLPNDNEYDINSLTTSEFVADFYSAGDSFVLPDECQAPSSPSGDFEVVSSKKRSKKFKSGSQTASQSSKSGGSDRWSGGTIPSMYNDDNFRGMRFCPSKSNVRSSSNEKPQINFLEGPRTVHDNTFLVQWSQYGVGERYGATTSVPHSEDSESDGDDSVHSMPVPSITPRPDVRKPPPSSGSTPQASYANIAKLAASANHAQMKRMSAASNCPSALNDLEKDINITETDPLELKSGVSESHTNILDDNFPSLTESLGTSNPLSAIFTSKVSELRTNSVNENLMIPVKVANMKPQQNVDKPKEMNSSGLCDGKSGFQEHERLAATSAISNQDDPSKLHAGSSSSAAQSHTPHQHYQPYHSQSTPSAHIQQLQAHGHHQNSKLSSNQHQNTHYTTSPSTPPLYYQYQRHNPFNRKDDDSPPNNRYPPPSRSPNVSHLSMVPSYPPPSTQQPPPPLKQSQFSQAPLNAQQNSQVQSDIPQSSQCSQNSQVLPQEKPQTNLNTHQYPPLQNPYSSPSPDVPKQTVSQQSGIAKNSQHQSRSTPTLCNSSSSQNTHPARNNTQQQNHHTQFSAHGQHQHKEQTSINRSPVPLENSSSQVDPSTQQQVLITDQCVQLPQQKNQSLELLVDHMHVQSNQSCSVPQPNSYAKTSQVLSSTSTQRPSADDVLKEDDNAQNLPVQEVSKDRQLTDIKSQCKSSDPSRLKKLEPAVVFTDNAKFDHTVSGLEFGFGFDEPIVTSDGVIANDSEINDKSNNVTTDFSKWFQAPKNDIISYNYEELIRHVSNEWEKTVQLIEGDPKNVLYWRASSSLEA